MEPLKTIATPAIPLALANVDTDQLIPARFMKRPRAAGYGPFLLHDLRESAVARGGVDPLGDPRHAGAAILVARRNFGSGSSREAAVYALADFGLRCIVAPSFGDIFASNAVKNGMLPARVAEADAEALLASLALIEGRGVAIDLAAQTIAVGNLDVSFAIDPVWKTQLMNGWDDIDLTLAETPAIARFRAADANLRPWARLPG